MIAVPLGFSSLLAATSFATFSAATSTILGGIELMGKGGLGGALATIFDDDCLPPVWADDMGGGGGVDVELACCDSVWRYRRRKRPDERGARGIEGGSPRALLECNVVCTAATAMYWADLAFTIGSVFCRVDLDKGGLTLQS